MARKRDWVLILVVSTAREHRSPHRHARDEGDSHGDRGGDGADEDVSVLDVGELVGEHGAKLLFVEQLQDPLRNRDCGVLLIAPGRKGVWLKVRRDVQPRHRQLGGRSELTNDAIELRRLLLGHRLGAGRRDRDLVAEPVRSPDE